MKSDTKNQKISIKAKVIFILIPFLCLLAIELSARFILPSGKVQDLETSGIPPVFAPADLDSTDEEVLERNYNLVRRGIMLMLPIHESDRDCFYHLVPNSSFSYRKPRSQIINYKINSLGFRGDEFPFKKEKDRLRIVCAGDSSTFGYSLNIYDTYPKRLENMLLARTREKSAEVINGGVLAYSSYQGVKYINTFIRKLQPDILIVSYGFNDSYNGWFSDAYTELESKMTGDIRNGLEYLATYRLLEKLLSPPKKKEEPLEQNTPRVNPDDFRKNLEKIEAICREDDIHLILLPISAPVAYQEVMRDFARGIDCGFIDIERILQEHHARFLMEGYTKYRGIPFGQISKKSFDNYHSERYGSREMVEMRRFNFLFMDFCHPTPAGQYIIAESIFEYLADRDFFTRARSEYAFKPNLRAYESEQGVLHDPKPGTLHPVNELVITSSNAPESAPPAVEELQK